MKNQVLLILKPSPARESLTQLLTQQGFEVEAQPSTFRAVSGLARHPRDIVIIGLDDLLDEELEVVKVIRDESPQVHILLTFTVTNRRKAIVALEMGADGYVLEPLKGEEVVATLRHLNASPSASTVEPAQPLVEERDFASPAPKAPVQEQPRPAQAQDFATVPSRSAPEKSPAPEMSKEDRKPTVIPRAALLETPATAMVQPDLSADRVASLRKLGASVAHEINNPLTTLSGWIQLLLKKANGNQDLRRTLVNMKEEADRIADVVRQLSAISEPDLAGRGPVDINTLADSIVEAFTNMNGNSKIRVKKIFTSAPPSVKADKDLLVRAVCDLLHSSYLGLGNSGSLVFTTTATGDAAEFHVYEPGSQVSLDALRRGMSSVDLGDSEKIGQDLMLARCQEIITSHGGTFTAECDPREGLNFTVRLPRVSDGGK